MSARRCALVLAARCTRCSADRAAWGGLRSCFVCGRELCPPSDYKGMFPDLPPRDWVEIVSARYGHVSDEMDRWRVDVADVLRKKVAATGGRTCEVGRNEDLKKLFGDPCPGTPKILVLTIKVFEREYTTRWEEEQGVMRWPVRCNGDDFKRGQASHREMASIRVLVAIIGEPRRPATAVEITNVIQKRINDVGGSMLNIDSVENLAHEFPDPCPGLPKIMIIRYRLYGRTGEIRVNITPGAGTSFFLNEPIYVEAAPQKPLLIIHSAKFGHPTNCQRAYDITELIQARIDSNGGEWLNMPASEDVHEWLGDPYVGSSKQLMINYEILPKTGQISVRERHGHLVEDFHIVAPVVAPLLHILSATIRLDAPIGFDPVTIVIVDQMRAEVDGQGGQEIKIRVDEDLIDVLKLRHRMPEWYIPEEVADDVDDNTTDYAAIAAEGSETATHASHRANTKGGDSGKRSAARGARSSRVSSSSSSGSSSSSSSSSSSDEGRKSSRRRSAKRRGSKASRQRAGSRASASGGAGGGGGPHGDGSSTRRSSRDSAESARSRASHLPGTRAARRRAERARRMSARSGASRVSRPDNDRSEGKRSVDGASVDSKGEREAATSALTGRQREDDGRSKGSGEHKGMEADELDLGDSVRHIEEHDDVDSVDGSEGGDRLAPLRREPGVAGSKGETDDLSASTNTLDSPAMRVFAKSLSNSQLMKPDGVDTSALKTVSVMEGVMTLGKGRTFRRKADGSWIMAEISEEAAAGTRRDELKQKLDNLKSYVLRCAASSVVRNCTHQQRVRGRRGSVAGLATRSRSRTSLKCATWSVGGGATAPCGLVKRATRYFWWMSCTSRRLSRSRTSW